MSSLGAARGLLAPILMVIAALLWGCGERRDRSVSPDAGCRCSGTLPTGQVLDVACGETQCIDGDGYRCTGPSAAVSDPDACGAPGDSGIAEPDGGVEPDDLCHSVGHDCSDGIPCCGDLECGITDRCDPPEGTDCAWRDSDCSSMGCCAPWQCVEYRAGWRCGLADDCAGEGEACADSGSCCGGLGCTEGRCQRRTVPSDHVAYGEYCFSGKECSSTPYCEDELCCIPSHWTNTTCAADDECCTGVCRNGYCDCGLLGGDCFFRDDCCGDAVCQEGSCCIDEGDRCSGDSDCCTGNCVGGFCECLPEGATATDSGQCCSLVLVGSTCA